MFSANKKSNEQIKNSHYSIDLMVRMLAVSITTCVVHPLRVCLNEASVTTNPIMTLQGAAYKMFRDIHLNILRGTSITGLQSIVKHYTNEYYGQDTYKGRVVGIVGAGLAGVFLSPIEIYFMRKNALRGMQNSIQPTSLLKFNKAIFAFLAVRELGFCISVFGTNDLSFYQKLPALLPSALITAIAHKLVYIEITKDIRQISHLVPDYGSGFRAAFGKIAYGDTYTHPTFFVPIKKPISNTQLAYNFFTATCGPNMFFWRLVYLAAFSMMLSVANKEVSRVFNNTYSEEEEDVEGVVLKIRNKK